MSPRANTRTPLLGSSRLTSLSVFGCFIAWKLRHQSKVRVFACLLYHGANFPNRANGSLGIEHKLVRPYLHLGLQVLMQHYRYSFLTCLLYCTWLKLTRNSFPPGFELYCLWLVLDTKAAAGYLRSRCGSILPASPTTQSKYRWGFEETMSCE